MQGNHVGVWIVLAAPLGLALCARGDSVDVQLRGADKVGGTIRPATDVECFLCDVAQNTVISASVKSVGKTGPAFKLSLLQGGVAVPGATFVVKGLGGSFVPFAVPASGQYQVCVSGDGVKDGDYALAVSWKPQASWTGTGGPLAASDAASFTFSAAAGTSATIDVLPAKGSKFKAHLVDLTGVGGFAPDFSGLKKPHAVVANLPTTGEYKIDFVDAGAWTAKVKLKPPKIRGGAYDLRDSASGGAFAGDHSAYGRIVESGGGTITAPSVGSPIDGSSVSIRPGTLGAPTAVTVAAGDPISIGGGSHAAGPAVDFGPSGTTFDPSGTDPSRQALITIPFDPSNFPGGDTSDLVVYVRAADGTVSQVPPPYAISGNTVTFPASHFSTYQASTLNPRPFEGSFVALEVLGDPTPNFEGQFRVGLERVDVAGGTAVIQNSDATFVWSNLGPQSGAASVSTPDSAPQTLDAAVIDDQTVQIVDPQAPQNPIIGHRGKSDDVLVVDRRPIVLLRRAAGRPTPATIAGTWHVFHLGFGATTIPVVSGPSSVPLAVTSETTDVTFSADGVVALGATHPIESDSDYPAGKWTTQAQDFFGLDEGFGISYVVDAGGQVVVTPDCRTVGCDPTFALTAVLDGNVLVGRRMNVVFSSAEVFLMIRASSGATPAKLLGKYHFVQEGTQVVDHPAAQEPPLAQDFAFTTSDYVSTVSSGGDVQSVGTQDVTTHDDQGLRSAAADQPFTDADHVAARSDGSFVGAHGAVGAVSIGGGLVVTLNAAMSGRYEIAFGVSVGGP